MKPFELAANLVPRFYRGGARIAQFRGISVDGDWFPEDWVASTVPVYGTSSAGMTILDDDVSLAEAMCARPDEFFGAEHRARFGAGPAVLVKLLDAQQRLPVHVHPTRTFARSRFNSMFGKTEAWIVLRVDRPDAGVRLGFASEVNEATLHDWIVRPDPIALLGSLRRLRVTPGDAILVPGGVPHVIDRGVFLVEVQEPTDLSLMLEAGEEERRTGAAWLGMSAADAVEAVDRSAWSAERIGGLRSSRVEQVRGGSVESLFPDEAAPYFRSERLRVTGSLALNEDFSVLVVVGGEGTLVVAECTLSLTAGSTYLVPYSAGPATLHGTLDVVRVRPAICTSGDRS